MKKNTTIFSALFLTLSLFLFSCQTSKDVSEDVGTDGGFPFFGIYEHRYADYNAPSLRGDYSGKYEGTLSGRVVLSGAYKDGIPIGTWKYFYKNGNLERQSIYDGAGNFQETYYYPDGSPLHYVEGTYSAKKSDKYSAFKVRVKRYISYDEFGNILFTDKNPPTKPTLLRHGGMESFSYEGRSYACIYDLATFKSNESDNIEGRVLAYVYPLEESALGFEKISATIVIEAKSKTLSEFKQTCAYGAKMFKLAYKIEDGMFYFDLRAAKSDELLLGLYTGKYITHIPQRLKRTESK